MLKKTIRVSVGWILLALPAVVAFSSVPFCVRRSWSTRISSKSHQSASNAQDKQEVYPGMSRDEVSKWMADIPVYAITSKAQQGGIVLLKDQDDTAAAYYFLTKDMAQVTLKQMQTEPDKMNEDGNNENKKEDWQILPFSLGMLWFQVFDKDAKQDDNIQHRLVANSGDLAAARDHVEQYGDDQLLFQKDSFNEIPIFMDLQMRITVSGEERFPMYLSVRDMVELCQEFAKTSENYQAAVNIANLQLLVDQMQQESTVNFRETLLVAPTVKEPPLPWAPKAEEEDLGEDYVPSMNTDW